MEKIRGLVLKVGPLGENDRLLTILSENEGIRRLAIPGARKPKSSLAATSPLTLLQLQISGRSGLLRVRQIKVLKSFSRLGENIETLAAGQTIAELCLMLFCDNGAESKVLDPVLIHLERLNNDNKYKTNKTEILAKTIQACVHLLALGGYCIPVQKCCHTGLILEPPIGKWEWRCSFIPDEGFALGKSHHSKIELNPSELALLQRLLRSKLPVTKTGEIMGPQEVWLKFLDIIQCWNETHLPKKLLSLQMLRDVLVDSDTMKLNRK